LQIGTDQLVVLYYYIQFSAMSYTKAIAAYTPLLFIEYLSPSTAKR